MYFRKADRDFVDDRLRQVEDMISEMRILDKRYIKTKDEEIIKLYNEKYSYLEIYVEDIKNTLNK